FEPLVLHAQPRLAFAQGVLVAPPYGELRLVRGRAQQARPHHQDGGGEKRESDDPRDGGAGTAIELGEAVRVREVQHVVAGGDERCTRDTGSAPCRSAGKYAEARPAEGTQRPQAGEKKSFRESDAEQGGGQADDESHDELLLER